MIKRKREEDGRQTRLPTIKATRETTYSRFEEAQDFASVLAPYKTAWRRRRSACACARGMRACAFTRNGRRLAPVQGPESRAAIQPVGAVLGLRPGPPISPHSPGLAVNRSPDLRISTLYSIIFPPPPEKKDAERDATCLAAARRSAEEPFRPVGGPNRAKPN